MTMMDRPENMVAESGVDVAGGDLLGAARPLRKDVWRRFRQNKLAVIGLAIIVMLIFMAIFAPLIAPFDYAERAAGEYRDGPSGDHLFGTDRIGRDVFSRIVYGARVSMKVGILATTLSLTIGILLGATAGFFGGLFDTIIMRVTDIFLAIPYVVLAVVIAGVVSGGRGSESTVIIVLGLTGWLSITRIVRASFLLSLIHI